MTDGAKEDTVAAASNEFLKAENRLGRTRLIAIPIYIVALFYLGWKIYQFAVAHQQTSWVLSIAAIAVIAMVQIVWQRNVWKLDEAADRFKEAVGKAGSLLG